MTFVSRFITVFVLASASIAAPAAVLAADPVEVAAAPAVEPGLLQSLSTVLYSCAVQPYGVNLTTGNTVFGQIRSHCRNVVVSQDRVEIDLDGRSYTFVAKDSTESDGGDLSDLFIQYDSREDQEALVATNVLAFGDPLLSVLLLTGHRAEELPRVLDPSLNRH